MRGFSCQYCKAWEIAGKPIEWEKPEKWISRKILQSPSHVKNLGNWHPHTFPIVWIFFSIRFCGIRLCGIHDEFPHQFPIALENAAKSIKLGEPRKLICIFSLMYGHFSSIRFPSCSIHYHMGNTWFFPSISNSTGKCSKIHPVSFLVVFP